MISKSNLLPFRNSENSGNLNVTNEKYIAYITCFLIAIQTFFPIALCDK